MAINFSEITPETPHRISVTGLGDGDRPDLRVK
jgi:hypothetical protein